MKPDGQPNVDHAATNRFVVAQPTSTFETIRYASSAVVVILVMAGAIALFARTRVNAGPSELISAVLVDLPSSAASSHLKTKADDGPEQPASEASAAVDNPPLVDRPKLVTADVKPAISETKVQEENPPPVQRDPDAIIERKFDANSLPPVVASATLGLDAKATPGSRLLLAEKTTEGDEQQSNASSRAMSLWQRDIIARLLAAKRFVHAPTSISGMVRVTFKIDRRGRMLTERVVVSSGRSSLDEMAMALVKTAAPFPTPPLGADDSALAFTVPIRFGR